MAIYSAFVWLPNPGRGNHIKTWSALASLALKFVMSAQLQHANEGAGGGVVWERTIYPYILCIIVAHDSGNVIFVIEVVPSYNNVHFDNSFN